MRAGAAALIVAAALVGATAASAVTLLSGVSLATPSVDLSMRALADGWHFNEDRFVDDGSTDDWHPATPSLRGFHDATYAGLLGFGADALPALTWAQAIRPVRLPTDRPDRLLLDAAALGAFDTASAQNFSSNSVAFGELTFKFAGQIGASGSSY